MKNNFLKNKTAIIAGNGTLPIKLAYFFKKHKTPFSIIRLKKEASIWLKFFKGIDINFGEIGKAIDYIKQNKIQQVILIGGLRRPSEKELKPDNVTKEIFKTLDKKNKYGDDAILKEIINVFEKNNINVLGIHELLNDVLTEKKTYTKAKPNKEDFKDLKKGWKIAKTLGSLDIGQSIVIQKGLILGVEAIEGTDSLIRRAGTLRRHKNIQDGILIKIRKPDQENRADLPTIGPKTVKNIYKAGLKGIAIEAENSLIVNPFKTTLLADKLGIFIISINEGDL